MKIVHVNSNDYPWGASKAAYRLHKALLAAGEDSTFLVMDKSLADPAVVRAAYRPFFRRIARLMNTLFLKLYPRRKGGFSAPLWGYAIEHDQLVREADIVHIHWIGGHFLSLSSIIKLVKSGKRVFMTMHDMWAVTGGCHYPGACSRYQEGCGACPLLGSDNLRDLSARMFLMKKKLFTCGIEIVACSEWLAGVVRTSPVNRDRVRGGLFHIPNTLDTAVFTPLKEKAALKEKYGFSPDKRYLLFGACNPDSDPRKGWRYLVEALDLFMEEHGEYADSVEGIMFGTALPPAGYQGAMKFHCTGFITDESALAEIYNCADLFVAPSLEDNLPNTILESLACGTPCAAFATGGIPELIIHKRNGCLAKTGESRELMEGIVWCLEHGEEAGKAGRIYVEEGYSQKSVAEKMIACYRGDYEY